MFFKRQINEQYNFFTMKKSIKISFLLFAAVIFIISDSNAQRGRRYGGGRGFGGNYGMVYRSRPSVSFGFGGFWGGYPRVFARPRVGFSIGLGFPGVGITIGSMPFGYSRFYFGGNPYYYYNDMYYRQLEDGRYQSVAPPVGSTVKRLPSGARERIIDGETYYEIGGTFFMEDVDKNGKRVYTVVGTDGELDTKEARTRSYENNDPVYNDSRNIQEPTNNNVIVKNGNEAVAGDNYITGPQAGDRFARLPKDCRTVDVNGVKQYVSPAGTYYKEVTEDGKTMYEVVRALKD